jgi:ubiquinone/menaquinone biosynthesis C-methylase UbiE
MATRDTPCIEAALYAWSDVSLYRRWVLPRLIHATMRQEMFLPYRQRLVSGAEGRVLEIGVGSGLNLTVYARAGHVVALDPSPALLRQARDAARRAACRVDLLQASAEAIPLRSGSVEVVVVSWTLCSITDAGAALREARRVLVPSGRLHFVEHGQAPDRAVARWQRLLTPAWRRLAGGCHLDRPVDRLIEESGFAIEQMTRAYMPGPRVLTFMYEGVARPR